MGFKYDDKNVKCPLFHRVVRTTKGQFIAVECEALDINIGFDVAHALRFRNTEDLKDYLNIFCKEDYSTCPYYLMQQKKKSH